MVCDSGCRNHGRRTTSVTDMVRRAWRLLRREGPFGFAMVVVRTYLADFRRFYLYEYDLWSKACTRLPPLPEGFDAVFVMDNDTADLLAKERCDFRCLVSAARHALDSGAIALCLYQGREMAHVGWIATSHAARRSLDRLEYEIRFDPEKLGLARFTRCPASEAVACSPTAPSAASPISGTQDSTSAAPPLR